MRAFRPKRGTERRRQGLDLCLQISQTFANPSLTLAALLLSGYRSYILSRKEYAQLPAVAEVLSKRSRPLARIQSGDSASTQLVALHDRSAGRRLRRLRHCSLYSEGRAAPGAPRQPSAWQSSDAALSAECETRLLLRRTQVTMHIDI